MVTFSTASMKYARPCVNRRSLLESWGSSVRGPSSLFGGAMLWCWVACVTPRSTVVSSRF